MLESARTFVLIHGAWHGGWCWQRVAERLAQRGCRVLAPTLSGLEDTPPRALPAINIQTHVDDVLALVDAHGLRDFVLVGHSYSGLVISGVADTLRERARHYVYLDAAVPLSMADQASVSWADFYSAEAVAERVAAAQASAAIAAPPARAFGVDGADAEWLQPRLRSMPLQTFLGRIAFRHGGSDGLPRSYLAATAPPYAALRSTQERLRADRSWSYSEIATGHDAMITAPDEVASFLLAI
jgi:pimeloyl-ACP methyl ester carboxylesterase